MPGICCHKKDAKRAVQINQAGPLIFNGFFLSSRLGEWHVEGHPSGDDITAFPADWSSIMTGPLTPRLRSTARANSTRPSQK